MGKYWNKIQEDILNRKKELLEIERNEKPYDQERSAASEGANLDALHVRLVGNFIQLQNQITLMDLNEKEVVVKQNFIGYIYEIEGDTYLTCFIIGNKVCYLKLPTTQGFSIVTPSKKVLVKGNSVTVMKNAFLGFPNKGKGKIEKIMIDPVSKVSVAEVEFKDTTSMIFTLCLEPASMFSFGGKHSRKTYKYKKGRIACLKSFGSVRNPAKNMKLQLTR